MIQKHISDIPNTNLTPRRGCGQFIFVDDVKRPLLKGETFLVPCIVREDYTQIHHDEQELYMDLKPFKSHSKKLYVTPVINLPHSDKENGQSEIHYHADYRFIKHNNDGNFPTVKNKHSKYIFCENIRPKEKIDGLLKYFVLPVINEDFKAITPVNMISKSNLKHKCIHKGKCPHRGYDLSQVKPIEGKITCPLHGLEFSSVNGSILNFPSAVGISV
jgi:Rieske [2Fe-2S] domain